jgi:hypothetical protein
LRKFPGTGLFLALQKNSKQNMMRYLLLLTLVASLFSCNNRDKIVMATSWKYDVEATRELMTKEPVSDAQLNFMEGVMNRLKDATVEFKKDNLLIINLNGEETTGYWKISGEQILMQVSKTSTPPYDIVEMTPQKLVLRPDSTDPFVFSRVMVPAK